MIFAARINKRPTEQVWLSARTYTHGDCTIQWSAARRLKGLKAVTKWIQMVGRGWKRRSCFTASKTTSWSMRNSNSANWRAAPLARTASPSIHVQAKSAWRTSNSTAHVWGLRTCQDKVNYWCFVIGCSFVTWRLEKATNDSMTLVWAHSSWCHQRTYEAIWSLWRKTWKLRQFQVG